MHRTGDFAKAARTEISPKSDVDLVSSSNLGGEIVQYSARYAVFIERASEDIVTDERNLGGEVEEGVDVENEK